MRRQGVYLSLLLALSCAVVSCGEEDPIPDVPTEKPEPEPEPDPLPEPTPEDTTLITKGFIQMQADWSDALRESTVPASYIIYVGKDCQQVLADQSILTDSLPEAAYPLLAYNEPKGIMITDQVARINSTEEGLLKALPEYLFVADTVANVVAGDTTQITFPMKRLLFPISLTLHFTQPTEVKAVEATLSGLISAVHIPDGKPVEEVAIGEMSWEELTTRSSGITLHVRTFGLITTEKQLLNAKITLGDNRVISIESDLTGQLTNWADLDPITLEAKVDTELPEPDPEPEPEPTPDPDPDPEPTPTPDPKPDPKPDPVPDPKPDPDPDVSIGIDSEITDWESSGEAETGEAT